MSFIQNIKNKITEFQETRILTSDEQSEHRYKICQSCEHFRPSTTQCKKCGCFMKIKTKIEAFSCPIDKW